MTITGHTGLYGIFANPIKHSISPAMHNAAFDKLGIDSVYLAFEVEEDKLPDAINSMRTLGMRGANISMPYKVRVMDYLDEISREASLIGAVNTIVNDGNRLTGYNTDGKGFMASLKENKVDIIGEKITVVGCGGAATAMIMQAALDGVKEISVFNRRASRKDKEIIVRRVNENTDCKVVLYDLEDESELYKQLNESVLAVNATGLGMKPLEGQSWLSDASRLRDDITCYDAIYSPAKTRFLQMAEERGCKIINGSGMLLYQGACAFKLWTDCDMPVEHVRKVCGL